MFCKTVLDICIIQYLRIYYLLIDHIFVSKLCPVARVSGRIKFLTSSQESRKFFIQGLRWRSGQSARLSPLRLRVRFSARTFSMLLEPSALLMCNESVNTLPKVVGFLRALRLPPTGKLTGWVRINTDREVKSQLL